MFTSKTVLMMVGRGGGCYMFIERGPPGECGWEGVMEYPLRERVVRRPSPEHFKW